MIPCQLCGFPDVAACLMLHRHEWIEWFLLLVVQHEAERVGAGQ